MTYAPAAYGPGRPLSACQAFGCLGVSWHGWHRSVGPLGLPGPVAPSSLDHKPHVASSLCGRRLKGRVASTLRFV